MLPRQLQTAPVAGAQQLGLLADRADRVEDVARRQPVAGRQLGVARLTAAKRGALGPQTGPGRPVDGAVHPAAAQQRFVGGVHDGVHLQRGDVSAPEGDAVGQPAVCGGDRRSGGGTRCGLHAGHVSAVVEPAGYLGEGYEPVTAAVLTPPLGQIGTRVRPRHGASQERPQ